MNGMTKCFKVKVSVANSVRGLTMKTRPSIMTQDQFVCIAKNTWFNIGNTGDCEIEWSATPAHSILARVLLAFPFFVLEVENRFSLHFRTVSLEYSASTLVLCYEEPFSICMNPGSAELDLWMRYLQNKFSADVDLYLRESNFQNRLDFAQQIELVDGQGSPSEVFMMALESSLRKNFAYSLPEGDSDWSSLLGAAISYQFCQQQGFGLLEALLGLPGLKEILVNRYDEVYVETHAGLLRSDAKFYQEFHFERLIENLLHKLECRLDASTPVVQGIVRARYRMHIVSKHIVPTGPSLSIRCFPSKTFQLKSLVSKHGQELGVCEYLESAVRQRKNIIVCGETSSGKTSLIEALSEFFSPSERVIVLEDVPELRLVNEHKIAMQTVAGFGNVVKSVDLRDLVKESLRMRPDRLVIGECRGAETLDLLQALNTGHAGSLTSVHGASPETALQRLETLAQFNSARVAPETVRSLLAAGIDLVVLMKRSLSGTRRVAAIAQVLNPRTVFGLGKGAPVHQRSEPNSQSVFDMPAYTLECVYTDEGAEDVHLI